MFEEIKNSIKSRMQSSIDSFKSDITIIGVGGIDSGRSVYEKIINGAKLVQLYTGMVFKGPNIVSKINDELIEIIKKTGVNNISELVGSKNKLD
jgi:dihydroorotate dehydrogenase